VKPHYHRLRLVKTKSRSTAVQVGYYLGKRFKLIKHIGSAKEQRKIEELKEIALEFIKSHTPQLSLNFHPESSEVLYKSGIKLKSAILKQAYDYLSLIYDTVGFSGINNEYLKNFSIIRVLEPASKVKSIELLWRYFGITYKKTTVFRELIRLPALKERVIDVAIRYAKNNLNFDFSLVFYDITTLYFETDREDEFRLMGFSKDNKVNQPQILIGILVERTGFPVYFNLFKGNVYEGKTLIPFINELRNRFQIDKFTVVADAGMLSEENLEELDKNKINYIVASRTKKLSLIEAREIASELNKEDGKTIRYGSVIYEYSKKRAIKDKTDNDKQIDKAKYYLKNPGKVFKRTTFIKSTGSSFVLNEEIIEKYRTLEGIKGYRTNIIDLQDKLLIDRYRDLWRVEQSFRIAKSDLEARPIFHRKRTAIEAHMLIVFVSLCMVRVIEQKEGKSARKVLENLRDRWTITLEDEISGNTLNIELNKIPH